MEINVGDWIMSIKNSYFIRSTDRTTPFIIKGKMYQVIHVEMSKNLGVFFIKNEQGEDHSFDFNTNDVRVFHEFFQTLNEYRAKKIKSLYEE